MRDIGSRQNNFSLLTMGLGRVLPTLFKKEYRYPNSISACVVGNRQLGQRLLIITWYRHGGLDRF